MCAPLRTVAGSSLVLNTKLRGERTVVVTIWVYLVVTLTAWPAFFVYPPSTLFTNESETQVGTTSPRHARAHELTWLECASSLTPARVSSVCQIFLLPLVGVLNFAFNWCRSRAFQSSRDVQVIIILYTEIAFSVFWGASIFSEVSWNAFLGAAVVVIGSASATVLKQRQQARGSMVVATVGEAGIGTEQDPHPPLVARRVCDCSSDTMAAGATPQAVID